MLPELTFFSFCLLSLSTVKGARFSMIIFSGEKIKKGGKKKNFFLAILLQKLHSLGHEEDLVKLRQHFPPFQLPGVSFYRLGDGVLSKDENI